MSGNSTVGVEPSPYTSFHVPFVQVLVSVFLSINFLLITTFSKQVYFYSTMRYILFAVTLVSDSLFLIMTDLLLTLTFSPFTIQTWLCLTMCIILSLYTFVTPVTLTAMTLERYVAICMPLRHAELCSTRNASHCILILHSISSVPCIVIFFTSVTQSSYAQSNKCNVDVFIVQTWQGHLRSALSQFYFLIMCILIIFSYFKIIKVAKCASGENKKSTWKGLRTVLLHAFQLLLCLAQFWCPLIEAAVSQLNIELLANVRYFNYVTFILAPRCLSPLIYGLRDDRFFLALKYLVSCRLYRKQSLDFH